MEKNFIVLLKSILEVRLDHSRVNDVDVSPDLYQIVFSDVENYGKVDTRIYLRNSKMKDYELSVRQLAALRLSSDISAFAAQWVSEFEAQPSTTVFQLKCREMQAANESLEAIKLRCVKRLKIHNKFSDSPDAPVYKDNCYTGHVEFSRDSAALRMGKDAEFFRSPEFGLQYKALKDKLQGTAVIPGKNTEANLVFIPVFELA